MVETRNKRIYIKRGQKHLVCVEPLYIAPHHQSNQLSQYLCQADATQLLTTTNEETGTKKLYTLSKVIKPVNFEFKAQMQFRLISKPKLISTSHVDFIRMGLKNNKFQVSSVELWKRRP